MKVICKKVDNRNDRIYSHISLPEYESNRKKIEPRFVQKWEFFKTLKISFKCFKSDVRFEQCFSTAGTRKTTNQSHYRKYVEPFNVASECLVFILRDGALDS